MKQFSRSSRKLGFLHACIAAWGRFALSPASSFAQQLTGTISGTAYDQSGAVVPKANVVLKNEASGDERTTVTGTDGTSRSPRCSRAATLLLFPRRFLELAGKRHRDEHR